eukprot:CAMPEP_0119037100 /NCGR_PEP_ID=MMETSP1177-20130426/5217_1 /TAXON_ID=2985 /ORGANISM="Ochromonas sp, Strain CCMP1899" /LENGTH=469 /DNA_ID=CAMNT_0006997863 /DNA_START=947 /DNA_END=2356 /DNA_ORIENTATION=+
MWIIFVIPTMLIAMDFVYVSLYSKRLIIDHIHYVAQLLWVTANAIWAGGELFDQRYDTPYPLVNPPREARVTLRWYSAWTLIVACVPVVVLYIVWLFFTLNGRITGDMIKSEKYTEANNHDGDTFGDFEGDYAGPLNDVRTDVRARGRAESISRYPSLPTMFHLTQRDLEMELNSSTRSSDKNKKERTSNRSDNSHRLEEGEEGNDNHDQGKVSLLGGKMLLQGYKNSSSSTHIDRSIDEKNLIYKNDNNNQKNEENLSSKSGISVQSDGENDRAYINKAYTNNPMIGLLSPNHSPPKDRYRSLSPHRSPLEDSLLPLNSPITLENCNSDYDTNHSYKRGMNNGFSTMTNGVSTMTDGVSTMTNGVSAMTNGVSTISNGVSTTTNGIDLGINCKYDESNDDDVINIDSAHTDGDTITVLDRKAVSPIFGSTVDSVPPSISGSPLTPTTFLNSQDSPTEKKEVLKKTEFE